jgi:hypothetical protein
VRVPLRQTVVINLNGAGSGTAKAGPISAREKWYPSVASVSANNTPPGPTNEAQCIISVGDSNTKSFRDGCVDGSSGDSTGNVNGDVIKMGEFVWAEWSGGDANVQARLTVVGEKEV